MKQEDEEVKSRNLFAIMLLLLLPIKNQKSKKIKRAQSKCFDFF
jgi:hypothetical protein